MRVSEGVHPSWLPCLWPDLGSQLPLDRLSLTDLDMSSLSPESSGEIREIARPLWLPLVSVIANQFPGSLVRKKPQESPVGKPQLMAFIWIAAN